MQRRYSLLGTKKSQSSGSSLNLMNVQRKDSLSLRTLCSVCEEYDCLGGDVCLRGGCLNSSENLVLSGQCLCVETRIMASVCVCYLELCLSVCVSCIKFIALVDNSL